MYTGYSKPTAPSATRRGRSGGLSTSDGPETDETRCRRLLAEFIRRSAAVIDAPYIFIVRGNCMRGLLRHLGLHPKHFCALLMACSFLRFRGDQPCFRADVFKEQFVEEAMYELRGPTGRPNLGVAEYSPVRVLRDACVVHRGPLNKDGLVVDNFSLRIGAYGADFEGTIDPAVEINKGTEPPEFEHRLRSVQRWFSLQIRDLIEPYVADENLPRAVEWACMEELSEAPVPAAASPKKGKRVDPAAAPTPSPGMGFAKIISITPSPAFFKTAGDQLGTTGDQGGGELEDGDSYGGGFDGNIESDRFCAGFPMLSRVNMPLFGRTEKGEFDLCRVNRDNLLREIVQLKKKHDEPLEFEGLNSLTVSTLLDVDTFKTRDEYSAGLDKVMRLMFESGGEDKAVRSILAYLQTNCNEALMKELNRLRLVPRVMDEFDVAALMVHANIEITHWRRVVQALKLFMGMKKVCASERKWRALGEGRGEVFTGEYRHDTTDDATKKNKKRRSRERRLRKERITFWWKDPVKELIRNMGYLLNGNNLNPTDIEFVHVANGGDHGKGKFRFTVKLIVKMSGGDYHEVIYPIGDVKCKKDNAKVLRATLLPKIDTGVNRIAKAGLAFSRDGAGQWECTLDDEEELPIDAVLVTEHNSFLAGDVAFLSAALGKEGYEKDWCYLCNLNKSEWQGSAHTKGAPWTIATLMARVEQNAANKAKKTALGGVKEDPFFKDIEVQRVIWSALHAMMGLGNDGVDFIIDFAEQHIERLPQEEVGLRNMIVVLLQRQAEARFDRDEWEKTDDGKDWKGISSKISYRKRQLQHGKGNLLEHQKILKQLEARQSELKEMRQPYAEEVDLLTTELLEANREKQQYRSDRKTEDESLYTAIDNILEKYKIFRSAYHSGQINGVGIKVLMDRAGEIMDDVKALLIGSLTEDSTATEVEVTAFCNNMKQFFILWDDAFAAVHNPEPTGADFVDTQLKINKAVTKMRDMNMTITPKAHGMEDHVVNQMQSIPGGISRMIEHWVERYHQVGFRYDDKWRNLKDEKLKAEIRSHREHIAGHREVVKRLDALQQNFAPGKKRKATLERDEAAKRVKREQREAVAAEMSEETIAQLEEGVFDAANLLLGMTAVGASKAEEGEEGYM